MKVVDYTPRVRLLCQGAAQKLVDLIARIENGSITRGEFSEVVLTILSNVYQLRRYAGMGGPVVVPDDSPPRAVYDFPFGVSSATGDVDPAWMPLFKGGIVDVEFPLYGACEVLFTRDDDRWRLWPDLTEVPPDLKGVLPCLREAQESLTRIVALMDERKIRIQILDSRPDG